MKTSISNARFLLIDDDPLFGSVLRRHAERRGVTIDYYESLIEALYETKLERYDAAIIDCCMPSFDGFDVAGYLTKFLNSIPIILVSAAASPFQRYQQDGRGAAAFVSKQLGIDAILSAAQGAAGQAEKTARSKEVA